MKGDSFEDKLYLYGNIPLRKVQIIEEAVFRGLEAARENLAVGKATKVRFWVLARMKNKLSSKGHTTKKCINIAITKRYLNSRNILKKLSGTVMHEYVHFLRLLSGRHHARTVLDASIEEGIAIFIQAILSEPPDYLDIKTLDEEMVRICWDKFSKILDRPAKKYPQIENNLVYRAIYYRLGFGIVRRFMELNPDIALSKLIKFSKERIASFAGSTYGKNYE